MNNIESAAAALAARDNEMQDVFLALYGEQDDNEAYKAVLALAVNCATRIFNILRTMRKPGEGTTHRAIMDLMVGLNGNPFWSKHGAGLMPLLHTAGQAQSDYAILRAEKAAAPTITANDAILNESQLVSLEVFVMFAYLLGGHEFMTLRSLEIKRRLAPYFMD